MASYCQVSDGAGGYVLGPDGRPQVFKVERKDIVLGVAILDPATGAEEWHAVDSIRWTLPRPSRPLEVLRAINRAAIERDPSAAIEGIESH